jgi:hypothetical protein
VPTETVAAKGFTTTHQVFEHHLQSFASGLDALMSDYSEESVIQLPDRTLRGILEIRQFFADFLDSAKPAFWQAFHVQRRVVEGDIAYLVWDAKPFVAMATDTLYVRNGKILVQTFTSFSP